MRLDLGGACLSEGSVTIWFFGCQARTKEQRRRNKTRLRLLLLLGLAGTLGAEASHALVAPLDAQHAERVLLHPLGGERLELGRGGGGGHREQGARQLGGHVQLVQRRVAGLGLRVGATREDDQLRLVLVQALDVVLQRLGRLVAATVVDGNADGAGDLLRDASSLK